MYTGFLAARREKTVGRYGPLTVLFVEEKNWFTVLGTGSAVFQVNFSPAE